MPNVNLMSVRINLSNGAIFDDDLETCLKVTSVRYFIKHLSCAVASKSRDVACFCQHPMTLCYFTFTFTKENDPSILLVLSQ